MHGNYMDERMVIIWSLVMLILWIWAYDEYMKVFDNYID